MTVDLSNKGHRFYIIWNRNGKQANIEVFRNIKSLGAAKEILGKRSIEFIYKAVYYKDSEPEVLKAVGKFW